LQPFASNWNQLSIERLILDKSAMQMMLFMRALLQTMVALVAIGRDNLSGWYVLLALLLLSVLLSGCAGVDNFFWGVF
jgi:hypothetical protein